jgi:hypothetical protein
MAPTAPPRTETSLWLGWRRSLARPTSPQSLSVVRLGSGLCIAWMVGVYLWPDASGTTSLAQRVTNPAIGWHFPYPGFTWIRPLPEPFTSAVALICVLSALTVAAGVFYRAAAVVLFLSLNYLWLIDQTMHGNHYTVACVLSGLLMFAPADRCYTLRRQALVRDIPFWPIFLLRGQLLLIYCYSGLHKLHPDWLAAEPIRLWLRGGMIQRNLATWTGPTIASAVSQLASGETAVYMIAYGGLLFDLSIGWLLLWRRTRLLGVALAIGFHVFNFFLIDNVSVVAPLALVATSIFLEPDWPSRVARWLRQPKVPQPDWAWLIVGLIALPPLGALLGWRVTPTLDHPSAPSKPAPGWLALGIVLFLVLQNLVVARQHFIPGDGYWTEEGMRFSWALLTKNKVGDFVRFRVVDPALDSHDPAQPIDWSAWSGERPEAVFRSVAARDFQSNDCPAFFVTSEPLLGQRIFARGFADLSAVQAAWRERTKHTPIVAPALDWDEFLAELKAAIPKVATDLGMPPDPFEELWGHLERRGQRLADPATTFEAAHRQFRGLANRLAQFITLARAHPAVLEPLLRLRPLALQGARDHGEPVWVLRDRALTVTPTQTLSQIDLAQWPATEGLYVDLDRMMAAHWRALPELVVATSRGGPTEIYWNPTHELTSRQLDDLAIMPYLLHSYAGHIATEWQARFSREPQVYGRAYSQLNHHPLQPLIDEQVDLTAVPLYTLRHNDWILPLERAAPGVSPEY